MEETKKSKKGAKIAVITVLAIVAVATAYFGIEKYRASTPAGKEKAAAMAADIEIKEALAGIIPIGEKIFERDNSYGRICYEAGQSIIAAVDASNKKVSCNSQDNAWAVQASLRSGGYWCVDYKENKIAAANELATTTFECI